jgi:hypothetical protein
MMFTLKTLYENRDQIVEGFKNTIIENEFVEKLSKERLEICKSCNTYDKTGKGCLIPMNGVPCCNKDKDGCGCVLSMKTRSPSSSCPKNYWEATVLP